MAQFQFVRDAKAFPDVAGLRDDKINWRVGDDTQRLFAMRVTDNLFAMAGIPLLMGRGLAAGEHDVVVVSHRMWRAKLASDPAMVGRTLVLDGRPHTVVGVLPEDHRSLYGMGLHPHLYAPVQNPEAKVPLYIRWPADVSTGAARERLRMVGLRFDQAMPECDFKHADGVEFNPLTGLQRLVNGKRCRSSLVC